MITGTNTATEAIELYKSAKHMFVDGAMNLREWVSNDDGVNSSFAHEDKANVEEIKGLGHHLDCRTDTIFFNHCQMKKSDNSLFLTKRLVLKTLANVFDPLVLICPVMVPKKIFLQDLWR